MPWPLMSWGEPTTAASETLVCATGPPGDPVIAVSIAPAAVAGEILAGISLEVGVDEALVVAVDRAHHARPGIGDAQIARGGAVELLALGIDDLRDHAEERVRRRAR